MSDQQPPVFTGEPTNPQPPFHPDGYIDPDPDGVLGSYRVSLECRSMQAPSVRAKVTVEGSALFVTSVLAAAADAFREDAER